MSISVHELTPEHDAELSAFLDRVGESNPSVLGYCYPFYRDMLVSLGVGQPMYLGARSDGDFVGYLPAFFRQSAVGTVFSSLPFFGPNAGVLCGDDRLRGPVHAALLRGLLERASKAGALSCSVYTPFKFDHYSHYDVALPEAVVVEKFTQHLDLRGGEWNSSVRYDLRKAAQHGLQVVTEITPSRIETFYQIYQANCADYGIPLKPKGCVTFLAEEALHSKRVRIYFALQRDQLVAGLMMIWGPTTASYYIPCTAPEARTLQPGTVLIDHAAADAKARGIKIWNWESSPTRESGVFHFKKKWGSVEGQYRVYAQRLCDKKVLAQLGATGVTTHFPYFFVYPFDHL